MRKINIILLLLILTILIKPNISRSTINSIVLTPANPTILSTGLGYYLAGKTYNFTVQVIDPDATVWGDITNVVLQIPNAGGVNDIQITTTFSGAGAPTAVVNQGGVTAAAGGGGAGAYNNFTITLAITFLWNMPESVWAAARVITATATTSNPAPNNLSTTQAVSYGVSSTVKLLNFALDGEAADGRINRWHNTFNATGTEIVFNVLGAAAGDAVRTRVAAGEIINRTLYINAVTAGTIAGDGGGALTHPVAASFFQANGIADSAAGRTVQFQAATTTAGGPLIIANTLSLICNQVQVTAIVFTGGGGVDNPPTDYYRATNAAGTQVQVTASMLVGGGAMEGNTDIEIIDTDGNIVTVTIPNGDTTGVINLTYPTPVSIPSGNTIQKSYWPLNVKSGAYSSGIGFGQYVSLRARITQPGPPDRAIYWNNQHWPSSTPNVGAGWAFYDTGRTTAMGVNSNIPTASSIILNWTPNPITMAVPPNGDFSSYKIYYKRTVPLLPPDSWHVIDKNTAGFAALGNIAANTVTITSLAPLTTYQYYFSAYDVFGNEPVQADNQPTGTITTAASSVSATVTDGISVYPFSSFSSTLIPSATSKDPALMSLRKTAIKISVSVISGGTTPDEVSILFANNNTDATTSDTGKNQFSLGGPGGLGTVDEIQNVPYYSIILSKSAPNIWSGFIPSDHALMTLGNSIRFIIGTKYGAVYSYCDLKAAYSNTTNWWDAEYRFKIASQPTFTPWPVRILNNVMNAENPICYPAYYLTDDAYVTISVFDLKGRPVVTLVDNQLRKGGQNIKEGGWDGSNKGARKIGVGIYYVRFYATRAADGKVILNEFRKVVMAR